MTASTRILRFFVAKLSDFLGIKSDMPKHGTDRSYPRIGLIPGHVLQKPRQPDSAVENAIIFKIDQNGKRGLHKLINAIKYWPSLRTIEDRRNRFLDVLDHIRCLWAALAIGLSAQPRQQCYALGVTEVGSRLKKILPLCSPCRQSRAQGRRRLLLLGLRRSETACSAR